MNRNKPAALKVLHPAGTKEQPPEDRDGVPPETCDILRDTLCYTRVGNVVPKKVIYALKPSASLATCMHLFAEKRILAAPVYVISTTEDDYFDDEDGVWTEMVGTETKCIALVNQIDLIHYINSLSLSKQAKLAQMRLGDVIEWQSFDRDISVPIRASVFKLMWFFSRATSKALLSDNSQACGIISQADINCYLADILDEPETLALHSVANTTLEQAGFGKDAFATCSGDISVVEAINILFEQRVGSLAVMDEQNGLIGEFSPRDLRGVGPNSFYRLKGKLVNYLSTFCPASLKPLTVTMDSTVGETTRMLADADKHCLWVVNEMYEPVQVVSLADVMRLARRGADMSKAKNLQTPRSQWSTIQSPAGATPGPSFDDNEFDDTKVDDVEEGSEEEEQDEELDEELDEDEDTEEDSDDSDYNPNLISDKDLPRLAGAELSVENVAVVTPREIQEAIWIPTEDEPNDNEDVDEGDVKETPEGQEQEFHDSAHAYASEIAQEAYEVGANPVQAYDDAYDHYEEAAINEAEADADEEMLHDDAVDYATEQAEHAEHEGYDPEATFNAAYTDYTEAVLQDEAEVQEEEQTEDIKAFVHQEASAFAVDKANEAYEHGLDPEEAYSEAYGRYNNLAAEELEESEQAVEEELATIEYEKQLDQIKEEEEFEAQQMAAEEAEAADFFEEQRDIAQAEFEADMEAQEMGQAEEQQYGAEFETESAMEEREAYEEAVRQNMELRDLEAYEQGLVPVDHSETEAYEQEMYEKEREAYEQEMYDRQQQAAYDEARLAAEEEAGLEQARQEAYEDAAAYENAREAAYEDAIAYEDARQAALVDADEAPTAEVHEAALHDAAAYDDSRELALQDAAAYEDAREAAVQDAVAYEEAAQEAYENAAEQTAYEEAAYEQARQAAYADAYEQEQERAYNDAMYRHQLEEEAYGEMAEQEAEYQQARAEEAAYENYVAEAEQAAYEEAAYEQAVLGSEQQAYEQAAYTQQALDPEQAAYEQEVAYEDYVADQEQAAYEQAVFEAEAEAEYHAEAAAQEDAEVLQAVQPPMSVHEEEAYVAEMEAEQAAYEDQMQVEAEEQQLMEQGYVRRKDYGYEYQPTPEETMHLSPEQQAEVAVSKFEATYVLLKAIRNLYNAGHLSPGQKSHLKNLTVSQAPLMIDSALRYLHTRDDYEFYSGLIEATQE